MTRASLASLLALFTVALVSVLVTSWPKVASAHVLGLSTGEYAARGASLHVRLAFARAEIARLVPRLDADGDGHVSPPEVEAAREDLEANIVAPIEVRVGGEACAPKLTGAGLTEEDGLLIDARFACSAADRPFDVRAGFLDRLAKGHRHVARAVGAEIRDQVLGAEEASFVVVPLVPGAPGAGGAAPEAKATPSSSLSFVGLGVEHILTGYDHLVFVVALVLVRARLRDVALAVTAFTVGHSVTLALATLDVVTPSARVVEPAIALSIAYVGVENLLARGASKRWRVTLPFGLVHGFGFAGALRELALPRAEVPAALLSFNVGVELGQLAVLAVAIPLVAIARRVSSRFDPAGVRVASAAVVVSGLAWFFWRVIEG